MGWPTPALWCARALMCCGPPLRTHRASIDSWPRSHDPASRVRRSRSGSSLTGGLVVCHNDVCLENVVFRDGRAAALIDFDFAAPGRPLFDLACLARMCVPIDDDVSASRLGWHDADRGHRLRLVAESYGLDIAERAELLGLLDRSMQVGGEFVRRRAEAGDPSFMRMWEEMGGQQRFDRRRDWWAKHRPRIESTVLAS